MQGLGARSRRDLLRKTWVPQGKSLKDLEEEKSVVIRFVVGYRCCPNTRPPMSCLQPCLLSWDFIPACTTLTVGSLQAFASLTQQRCTPIQMIV